MQHIYSKRVLVEMLMPDTLPYIDLLQVLADKYRWKVVLYFGSPNPLVFIPDSSKGDPSSKGEKLRQDFVT